jgi:tRNA pseudouridine55 synthase
MNGLLVLDKPPGMTSAQVVGQVKDLLKAKKTGHTGTLDPFATGVLLCCVNRATKLARFLVHGRKVYEGVMHLGIRTDTQDRTGRIISRAASLDIDREAVCSVFRRFLEIREQSPPAFSALKHRGTPLYKLARRGHFIQKPPRRIRIYELELLAMDLPRLYFKVSCSQGTYVRTLCADVGETLGCGAHLAELRRIETGGFTLDETLSLKRLKEQATAGSVADSIIPINRALRGVPEVRVGPELVGCIRHGRPISKRDLGLSKDPDSPWIKIVDGEDALVAVLESEEKDGAYRYACILSAETP